ncbi:ESX secretion-associated protein EspG [Haloechinothrix halophila]|uniref:ESX secretion-associated protein EspG n=1 Tax=Haloechinothrix halophila TaxID=1069073 RepID=UPI0004298EBC|nr:ESX secretion-associated protein EspG [Haloechinothrix halophila]
MSVPTRLSLPAVDILFEDLGLGQPPQPFEVPVVGDTIDERARLREATHGMLEQQGLMRAGRVYPALEHHLVLLSQAPFALVLTGDANGTVLLARGVSDGRDAVVGRQDGNYIVMTPVRATAVIPATLDVLPRIPAGRGTSATMPMPGQQRHRSDDDENYNPLAAARDNPAATGRHERTIARVFEQDKLGLGSLTASIRSGNQPRWQRLCQLTWWDFDQERGAGPGRWFTSTTGDPPQLSLHPGDSQRLTHFVQQLVGPHLPWN